MEYPGWLARNRRHVVAACCAAALFMEFLDLTIVNVAMPAMGQSFNALPTQLHWVTSAYMLALAGCVLLSGWMQIQFGSRQVFAAALSAFMVASVGCGLATSLGGLVAMRFAQGLGAGMMAPVGFTLVLHTYPDDERARIASLMLVPSFLAMVLGPFCGGLLLTWASWPWIFFINVPVGLLTVVVTLQLVPKSPVRGAHAFDAWGCGTSSIGLASMFLAFAWIGEQGRFDWRILSLLGLSGASMAAFIWVEKRHAAPLIDLRIFSSRLFAAGALTQLCTITAVSGSLFVFTLSQQVGLQRSALLTGTLCAVQALAYVIFVPIAAALRGKVNEIPLVLLGIGMFWLSTWLMGHGLVLQHMPQLLPTLVLRGAGMALCLPTSWTRSFRRIDAAQYGCASAAMTACIQLGNALGLASGAMVLRSVDNALQTPLRAYQLTFYALSGFVALGFLAAFSQRDVRHCPSSV